jgi:hypothetical protein
LAEHTLDLILHNANVLTMSPPMPRARAVAVRDGRIVWVGSEEDVSAGMARAVIDCEGKTIIPGFNDAHMHFLACAARMLSVDCSPAHVSSINDIKETIRKRAAVTPYGSWIRASGYNEFYLAERRHPTCRDLDEAAPHHPVRLAHRSMHACVLNSAGLRLAGISIETEEPPGGLIDRDLQTGEPNGILFGMNSFINEKVLPPLADTELAEGVRLANRSLLSCGITSIQDATETNGYEQWRLLSGLKAQGEIAPRVVMMFGIDALDEITEHGLGPRHGDHDLRLGAAKVVLDETNGRLHPPQDVLNELVMTAHRAGFQVAIHAVEEGTVDAAAAALESCHTGSEHRHRLEHCSVCPPPLLERLSALGAIVVTQPAFIYYSGERYLAEVPKEHLPWLYRIRSFRDAGLRPAGSSDCPVVPCEPMEGIYAAATRRAESGQVLSLEEAVAVEDALAMYTIDAAHAAFEEESRGSIEVGKLADLVVLSDDPTRVPADELRSVSVEKTIIGGAVVWER